MSYKKFGIDISAWQGNYNLTQAKNEGVEFVIIKGGGGDDGYYVDSRFSQNYDKAKSLGLPVGCYWFSRALNPAQAEAEAEYFYQHCLKGKQFELPIYIDVENRTQLGIGKRLLTDTIKAWLKYLEKKGYYVGVYSSSSFFRLYMYDEELTDYAHWVAQWSTSCVFSPSSCFGLWQFGGETNYIRSHTVAGQTTDQNYLIIDYETEIKKAGLNGWGKDTPVTPTPEPTDEKLSIDGVLGYYSVSALQKWMGTTVDGIISGQLSALAHTYPALIAVEYGSGGSPCIEALQRYLEGKGYTVGSYGADGYLGHDTVTALQNFLIKQGYDVGSWGADGILGEATAMALQKYLIIF